MSLKKSCFSIILLIFLTSVLFQYELSAQLTIEHNDHIKSILENVTSDAQPGVAVSIIKDGQMAFTEVRGLANADSKKVSDEHTIYQVDALANQFTTLAFLHLIESSSASLSDEIHQYLPQLPKYASPITLKHVLNHTTGLNDYQITQQLGQSHVAETNAEAMALITSQEKLAFQPGTEFSVFDAKTESLLMAEIIAAASKMPFVDYMQQHVFEPYGLNDARFIDNENIIISNKAKAYGASEGSLYGISNTHSIVGPSNLWISISDVSKWYQHFSPTSTSKLSKKIKKLDSNVRLDDGTPYHSQWGTMTIGRSYLHLERGIPKYWQYGLLSGFGANVFRYPEQDLFGIALGNNNQYNGYYAMEILLPIMDPIYKEPSTIDVNSLNVITVSEQQKTNWVGDYMNYDNGMIRSFHYEDDTLRYGPRGVLLVPIATNTYQALMQSDDVLIFEFHERSGQKGYTVVNGAADPINYTSISDYNLSSSELKSHTGKYVNAQLDLIYEIALRDGQLVISNTGLGDTPLRPIERDLFATQYYALSNIVMHREDDHIVQLEVKAPGIGNLFFNKVMYASGQIVKLTN